MNNSNVRDSFVPNAPTMALMALPYQAAKNRDIPIPVLMLMLAPAVVTNFPTGWPLLPVSPRFFAAWLMWAAAIGELRRESRQPN